MSSTSKPSTNAPTDDDKRLHENAITWELIAAASKLETPAVSAMALKALDTATARRDALAKASECEEDASDEESTSESEMQSAYFVYPSEDLPEFLYTMKMHRVLRDYDLVFDGVDESAAEDLVRRIQRLQERAKCDKKDKKGKKGKKGKTHKTDTMNAHESRVENDAVGAKGGKAGKGAKGKKAPVISARERIRQQQVRTLAQQAVPFFDKTARTVLHHDFSCQVVEVIALYYMYVAHYSFEQRLVPTFIDALFSLRDALKCFRATMDPGFYALCAAFMARLAPNFPWPAFLQHFTKLLIKTHFKKHFQKAIRPFPEQAALIDEVVANPFRLFVLPWGVGTGKTAMLPPLAQYYQRTHGHQTLYCVPFGPVRDQSAALLYRCGIPFAYVVRPESAGAGHAWELQPSYHCGDGKQPQVYIVDPPFVRYYSTYWEQFRRLVGDTAFLDARENPPNIHIPCAKRRYQHLSHAIWKPDWMLVLDEPCENNDNVMWVLHHLPRTTFVMSATSWELVTDAVQVKYATRHGATPLTIPANTIGVSTTLIGYWLEGQPVLSPFHGVQTRQAFVERLEYLRDKVLWKRFLSAQVLCDWAVRIRKVAPHVRLSVAFAFDAVTFDSICARVLEFCDTFAAHPDLDDAFYRTFFAFGTPKPPCPGHKLLHLLKHESAQFMHGCIVGTPTVKGTYDVLAPMLASFPSLRDIRKRILVHRKDIVAQLAVVQKMSVTKKDDQLKRQEKLREIEGKKQTSLPIPDALILNTPEYLAATAQPELSTRFGPVPYLRVQELLESGDPVYGLDNWQLEPDTMQGNFEQTHEQALMWRWKGLGAIVDHKEFNMKNITDLDRGYVGFLLLDKLGAQGLNLKIRHGVLMRGEDGKMLPVSTSLQIAGRVGRWGQEGTGYVYIMDEELFVSVFG